MKQYLRQFSEFVAAHYVAQVLLLACVYAITALVTKLVQLPPASAAPIWIPAGIALAGLIAGGLRLWPGVWLGYLIFAVLKSDYVANGVYADIPWAMLLAGAMMAVGPTLQAVAGAWFARRQRRGLQTQQERSILRTLLLAGPVSCCIAASCGLLLLFLQGYVQPEAIPPAWFLWWFSDTVGALLITPLAMMMLPIGRAAWGRRRWQIAMPLVGAAALLIPGVFWFHDAEEAEARRPLLLTAGRAYDLTLERLNQATDSITDVANYFAASTYVTPDEFEQFSSRELDDGVLALAWIPRVGNDRRGAFEAAARQNGDADFVIKERFTPDSFRISPVRAEYYPVLYMTSPYLDLSAIGFDMASEPVRVATISRARDSAMPTASEPIMVRSNGDDGIVVLVPLFEDHVNPASIGVAERRDSVRGFVGGVIDPDQMGKPLLVASQQSPLLFRLTDVTPGYTAQSLVAAGEPPFEAGRTLWSRDIDYLGRTWRLEASAEPDYWVAAGSTKSRVFLLTAILGIFLISLQTLAAANRDHAVNLKVAARTRELAHNRRRLRGALSVASVACWDLDLRTGRVTLDDKSFEILRTTARAEGGAQMPVGRWVEEFVHPEDAAEITSALTVAAHEQASLKHAPREIRVRARNGETRHLQMYFDVDTDSRGVATRILGSSQDVTSTKQAELALRESEAYARSILASSNDCIKVLRLDGRLLDINEKGCQLLGIEDPDAVKGVDFRGLYKHPEHYAAACAGVDRAAAGGTARFEGFCPTMDGTPKWWDIVLSPIAGRCGEPERILCVSRDITAEYQAREEIRRINEGLEIEIERRNADLAASERELRTIFNVMAVGVAHIGLDNRVLRVNPKLCEITGFEEERFLRQHDFNRTHKDDRDREQELIRQLLAGEVDTYVLEKRFFHRNDSTIWLRVTGSLVRDEEGEPLYRVVVVEDISLARAERELRISSERRYRELFDRNPMPMWTYDSESLAFTSANDAAVRHYGYSREEFLSMTLRDMRPDDQQATLDELLAQRQPGYSPAHEAIHRRKDGTEIIVEVTAHGIVHDGRPARLVLANDVTDRRRSEILLEGQKKVLENITSGAAMGDSLRSLASLAESAALGVRCGVMVAEQKTGTLRHLAAPRLEQPLVDAIDAAAASGTGFFHELAGNTDATLVQDIAADERWNGLQAVASEYALHACWSIPIRDAAGGVLGAFVLYYDEGRTPTTQEGDLVDTLTNTAAIAITKHRESRQLAESQERFRSTFESSALGILHVGLNGKFIFSNPSVCQIIGYSAEEMQHLDADLLSHPDDIEIGQTDRARLFQGEIPSYSVEKRYIHRNGSVIWLAVTISTVRDSDGAVQYAVALVDDISWRKQAEDKLHQQQEINRLLLENLTEGVVACDAEGNLMLFNKAAREWHGADPREIPPEEWSDYYDLYQGDGETPLPIDQIPLMRAFRGERVKGVEMSIVRKGHPPRIVLASGAPLLDADGRKRGAVVVMHDVTMRRQSLLKLEKAADKLKAANAAVEIERASLAQRVAERTTELTKANSQLEKAKEAAESASRAKSAFLAVMSHEIRTPMNGILGMADILSQSTLSDDQGDAVQTIRDSSFSLLRLIDDILDFSKVEAGRLEFEREPISVAENVEAVCDALTADALSNDVDLQLYVDPQIPEKVIADATRLRQLMFNLVGNAIKFSGGQDSTRGHVTITVERASTEPLAVSFRVADNGIGIPQDALPRLFDSFTQAEASTTRRFGGTGLGLAISRRLVDLMDGTISVSSTLGEGSEFHVHLPFTPCDDPTPNPEYDLDELRCALLGFDDEECEAMVTYLEAAGAFAAPVADIDAARGADDRIHGPLIVIRRMDAEPHDDREILALCGQHNAQVNLVITRGPRNKARIVASNVVVLQASAIRRRDFLQAVAVAAGRASPEATEEQAQELLRGQLFAPTVSQARNDGRLILVAEDDPINQKVILRQLSLLGYAGELARNGREAFEMWQQNEYALLLTDLHMPEMDGYELAKSIRKAENGDESLPILVLTANALRGEAERALAEGFDAYLTKPLQLSVLGEALNTWLPGVRDEQAEIYMQAAATTSNAAPPVDTGVLRDIIGDDDEMMFEFLGEFLDAADGLADEFQELASERNLRKLAERAHRQKGAARAIGAIRLGDTCAEIENAARADDAREIDQLVTTYESRASEVERYIHELQAARAANAPASANADNRWSPGQRQ